MATEALRPDELGDELEASRMPLVDHLAELRDRLIKCVVAVVVGMVVGFVLYDRTFDLLIDPYAELCESSPDELRSATNCALLVTDPLEGFAVRLRVAAYTGVAVAMPVLLWQAWRFISPGLYRREKRLAVPFVASALVLFVLGAGLAYTTLPRAIEFLVAIGGDELVTAYSPAKYFQLITYMMLAFGIGFEFPILLVFLQLADIVQPETLARLRRYAIVGIAVLVAVITPSGDPISMGALTIPMVLFYEASILLGKLFRRRRRAASGG